MRRRLAFVLVLAAALGYLARCEADRRLRRLRERRTARRPRGRPLLPGIPHRYAPELFWPGSCWCSRPQGHPVHRGTAGGPR